MTARGRGMSVLPIRGPSAVIPIAMSLAALSMVLVRVATVGVVHEPDEGTAAHVFQLLLGAQVPVAAFFAIKWLPRLPGQAARVLVLQACAGLLAVAAAHWLT